MFSFFSHFIVFSFFSNDLYLGNQRATVSYWSLILSFICLHGCFRKGSKRLAGAGRHLTFVTQFSVSRRMVQCQVVVQNCSMRVRAKNCLNSSKKSIWRRKKKISNMIVIVLWNVNLFCCAGSGMISGGPRVGCYRSWRRELTLNGWSHYLRHLFLCYDKVVNKEFTGIWYWCKGK